MWKEIKLKKVTRNYIELLHFTYSQQKFQLILAVEALSGLVSVFLYQRHAFQSTKAF